MVGLLLPLPLLLLLLLWVGAGVAATTRLCVSAHPLPDHSPCEYTTLPFAIWLAHPATRVCKSPPLLSLISIVSSYPDGDGRGGGGDGDGGDGGGAGDGGGSGAAGL